MDLAQEPKKEPASTAARGQEPSASKKSNLRGTTFAEGEAALAPEGSMLVAGASQSNQVAKSNNFTPKLMRHLAESPKTSLDQAIALASSGPVLGRGQLATSAAVGNMGGRDGAGKKSAVFLANQHYKDKAGLPELHGVKGEAAAFEGALSGRGYQSLGVHMDMGRGELAARAHDAVATGAGPGDHVVVHYGGHGLGGGLAGVNLDAGKYVRSEAAAAGKVEGDAENALKPNLDVLGKHEAAEGLDPGDLLPYGELDAIAKGGVGKGVHVTLILDSCHAGKATDLARERRDFGAGGGGKADGGDSGAADAARSLVSVKHALVHMVEAWQADELAVGEATQDPTERVIKKAEIAARYTAALKTLWQEYLQARIWCALNVIEQAAGKPITPPPPLPPDVREAQALFDWLDETAELGFAAKGPKPDAGPGHY